MSTERPELAATGLERLTAISDVLGIGRLRHHVLLCADQSVPRCSTLEESQETWRYLKGRLKELDLASAPPAWRGVDIESPPPAHTAGLGSVLRSKVDCLRICESGPICVVYPEGIWYHSVDVEVMQRIVDEHLVGGVPVAEYQFVIDGLASQPTGSPEDSSGVGGR